MPTFHGFDGEKFQVEGKPNKFYNLLTDEYAQINAHFNSYRNVDSIGIKLGSPVTRISWKIQDERPKINNKELYTRSYFNLSNQSHLGYAEINFMFEASPNSIISKEYISCLFINGNKYCFTICKLKNNLELSVSICNRNSRPHGIIGQTADFNGAPRISNGHNGEGIIAGKLSDYELTDLWANNFKYNRFKESA